MLAVLHSSETLQLAKEDTKFSAKVLLQPEINSTKPWGLDVHFNVPQKLKHLESISNQ